MSAHSDIELLKRFEYYLFQIESEIQKNRKFCDVTEDFPFIALCSDSHDLSQIRTNKIHEELTGYSSDTMQKDFGNYLKNILHPAYLNNVPKMLKSFYSGDASCRTLVFIQYVKLLDNNEFTPLLTFAKQPHAGNKAVRIAASPQQLSRYSSEVERILKVDKFKLDNLRKFQQLSERELQILKMLAEGINNPGISDHLFISRLTVETHRKKINSKLGIKSFRDLMRYAMAFDLVSF